MNKVVIKIIISAVLIILILPISAYAMGPTDNLAGTISIVSDGTPQYDEALSVNISNIENNTGELAYQWLRNGADISGAASSTYTLIQEDIGKNISVRVTSTVETGEIVSASVLAAKADRAAPAIPTIAVKSNYTITLNLISGCEYKIQSGSFSSANAFNNLIAGTEYVFYQRYAETDIYNASPSSVGLTATTEYITISNTTYDISSLKAGDGVIVSGTTTLSGTKAIRVECAAGTALTLKNATINIASMSGEAAIKFSGSGNKLILSGSNSVYSGSTKAGIETTGTLTISGTGSLYSSGGTGGAGIGGSSSQSCGTIYITDGKITAVSGSNGAGIGGGTGGAGGSITISSGVVFASGSSNDIGGGSGAGSGSLLVSDTAAVFLKNNSAPTTSTSTHTLYSNETVTDGKAYNFSLPSSWQNGKTAYAYLRMFTVQYISNGGSTVASHQAAASSYVSAPVKPTKTGFVFGGWYKESELTNKYYFAAEKVYSNTILYAKWNIIVTINIGENGTVTPSEKTIVESGDELTITCKPDDDYYVGEVVSTAGHTIIDNKDDTYTIKKITKQDTITITFECINLLGSVMVEHDGVPEYGDMLSVFIKDVRNNPETALLEYQWLRDGVAINEATKETYTITGDDINHKISVRVSSTEKEGFLESAQTDKVQKAMRPAPRAPSMLERTKYSITLYMLDGCEYKMNDGEWQESNLFTDLEPKTEYLFYQRYAATGTHKNSNSSFSVKIETDGYHISDLDISENSVKMNLNEQDQAENIFHYTLLPDEADNKEVVWNSSNEKVAIIDNETGIIKAVGVGKTIISISAEDTTNGTLKDTCLLQVIDPVEVNYDGYFGILEGIILDENGDPVQGCNITLYSNPVTVTPSETGEYYLGNIPYTNHTLIVEKENGEEIARFLLSWSIGDKNKAYIDNSSGSINIVFTDVTYSTNIPIVVSNNMDDAKIKSASTIVFLDEDGNELKSKKVYMLFLMGIIAACIIGVGYILYIGRAQSEETGLVQQNESGFYEQQMISYDASLKDEEKAKKEKKE